ncbi:hypothetical protein C8Q80DRAFT_1275378 [Daedaleopsis nitida]|nr:hypothetical protein C8Q80DRAFT_1275378 [Daedaleopsis nitida]
MLKTDFKTKTEAATPHYTVPDIVYCCLVNVIKGVLSDPVSRFKEMYHWFGHQLFWSPPAPNVTDSDSISAKLVHQTPYLEASPPDPIQLFTDFYDADAVLAEEAKLQKQLQVPTDLRGEGHYW